MNALVRFAISAMYPAHGNLPGAADTGLREFVEQLRRESGFLFWFGVTASSVAFMMLPILTIYLPVPAVLLSRARLDQHAHRFATHRIYLIRQAAFILKMAGGLCWAAHSTVRERMGLAPYEGDPGTWRTT